MTGPQVYPAREHFKTAPDAVTLTIGLPTRGAVPVEFMVGCLQMLPPLNVKLAWCIQKGMLPAAARNSIIERSLAMSAAYCWFLDDDVLYPDVTLYRLWVQMQTHPEAGIITAVVPTKIDPSEPMIYFDQAQGAAWDWPLGALVPIESAAAGCMIVNLDLVRRWRPTGPWFNDSYAHEPHTEGEVTMKRRVIGHDRHFFQALRDATGCVNYADTGLLMGHFDARSHRVYTVGETAPCFRRPPAGEAFVAILVAGGAVTWRRIYPPDEPSRPEWVSYLDWLQQLGRPRPSVIEMIPSGPEAPVAVPA